MWGEVVFTLPPGLMVRDCPTRELPSKLPAFIVEVPPLLTIVLPEKLLPFTG